MRVIARLFVAVLAFLAPAALAAPAASAKKPITICWNKDYPQPVGGGEAQARVKPSKCGFFKRGEVSNSGAVRVTSIDWNKWGNRKARGVGVSVANMGARARVEVKLSKPTRNCAGKQAFSKATFHFDQGSSDFKMYTCPEPGKGLKGGGCQTVRTDSGQPLVFFKQHMKCSTAKKYAHRLMASGGYDAPNFKCQRSSPTSGGCTHERRPRKFFVFYPEH